MILSEKLREAEANRESLLEQMNASVDENSRLQAALRVSREALVSLWAECTTN
ncbi:hypothetical protein H0H93_006368, partial [Arthromyces matolae]